jgi:hypothetical protein
MKDARGHGSNGRGAYLGPNGRSVIPSRPFRGSDGSSPRNGATDADAAEALNNTKALAPEVHPAFGKRTSAPAAERPKHPVEIYKGNPL